MYKLYIYCTDNSRPPVTLYIQLQRSIQDVSLDQHDFDRSKKEEKADVDAYVF